MRKRTVSLYDLCKENQFGGGYEYEEDDPPEWYREIMVSMRWPNDKEIANLEKKYRDLEKIEEVRRAEAAIIEEKKEHERFLGMSIEEKIQYLSKAKAVWLGKMQFEYPFLCPELMDTYSYIEYSERRNPCKGLVWITNGAKDKPGTD